MAINGYAAWLIKDHIHGEILSLGYPNFLLNAKGCEKGFGVTPMKFIDPPSTIRMKGEAKGRQLVETRSLFSQLGATLTCVDAVAHEGVDIVADLNYPQQLGEFDLVIDAGTIEHCFNIGQAIINASNAVKVGGTILHTSPMTMVNHGFYNLNPTLFMDYYKANGFDIIFMSARNERGDGKIIDIAPFGTFDAESGCALYVLAQRREKLKLVMPIQAKYKSV